MCRFLELMFAKNITLWAISTGNEPLNGVIGWLFVHFMSLGWTPRNQVLHENSYLKYFKLKFYFYFIKAIYLNDYLGPILKNSTFKNILIFGNDDQRYTYPAWFQKVTI